MHEVGYNISFTKTAKILAVSLKKGLSEDEALARQKKFGLNRLPTPKLPSKVSLFLLQLKSPLIYILLIAGLITLVLGELSDSLVIFAAVLINAGFGFWQENKSLAILDKLKKVIKTKATLIREGKKKRVFQEEIVVGDVIALEAGDKVAADARLFEVENLLVSQAALTGEWLASRKSTAVLSKKIAMADRSNMVYAGSLVESGQGKAVVTAIGGETEIGKIATLISEAKEELSPLGKKLVSFGKTIGLVIVIGSGLIFAGGLLRHGSALEMFETAVAIAVGGIPEALPVVMTVILAIGMDRLLKKKGLIRKLSSVETLGSTSVICFDKTKTLTKGEMVVDEVMAEDEILALRIAVLSTEAYIENPQSPVNDWKLQGSPTGRAILLKAAKKGLIKPRLEVASREIKRLPFDPVNKYLLSLRREEGEEVLYILGAPEKVLAKSGKVWGWKAKAEEMMQRGLRVVAVGYKRLEKSVEKTNDLDKAAGEFVFAGLIGLKDPVRKGIRNAIKISRQAGIKPIIITGDHWLTTTAVGKEVGIDISKDEMMAGNQLDKLTDVELGDLVIKLKLFWRAEPKHKIRVVRALQRAGEVVAMVGDGVNDAPAIKRANIGLALGSGTEVAIEAADLVLLNDSFKIIVKAIREGRVVLDNLRKSIAYILSDSFTSVILIGFAKIVFGWPLPILPVQILWNNFVEDTVPDIAFAFEPMEEGVMRRKPDPAEAPLMTLEMKILVFGTGLIDEILMVLLFWYLWVKLGLNLDYVRTMMFGAISIDTAFVVYAYKNLRRNIWKINILSNKILILSSVLVFVSFAAAIYIPFLQKALHTVPLGIESWLILAAIGVVSLLIVELTKWFFIVRHLTE